MKVFTALTMILALPLFVSAGEPQPQPVEKIFTGSGTWKSSDGKMGTVTETVNPSIKMESRAKATASSMKKAEMIRIWSKPVTIRS